MIKFAGHSTSAEDSTIPSVPYEAVNQIDHDSEEGEPHVESSAQRHSTGFIDWVADTLRNAVKASGLSSSDVLSLHSTPAVSHGGLLVLIVLGALLTLLLLPPIVQSLSGGSASSPAFYNDCVASFADRNHPSNDGVSLVIGMLSVPERAEWRSRIRDNNARWLPPPVNIAQYCSAQLAAATAAASSTSTSLPTRFAPIAGAWPAAQHIWCDGCPEGAADCVSGVERHQLDMSWYSVYDNIHLSFVVGQPHPEETRRWPEMLRETDRYGDLHILYMEENKDHGKVYQWLRELEGQQAAKRAALVDHAANSTADYPYDLIMKMDDDSFLHIPNTIRRFRRMRAARLTEVFYGYAYIVPDHFTPPHLPPSAFAWFHSGLAYTFSDDLLTWLASDEGYDAIKTTQLNSYIGSPIPNPNAAGYEDALFGPWFTERGLRLGRHIDPKWRGNKLNDTDEPYRLYHSLLRNFINAAPYYYYYPEERTIGCQMQFHPLTEAIHWNKRWEWHDTTIQHFMCERPHTFNQSALRPGDGVWRTDVPHVDLVYQYDQQGELVPQYNWWNDWGQAYRQIALGEQAVFEPITIVPSVAAAQLGSYEVS